MPHPHSRKSGQAIIFLMVVMVIGLLVVVWNFDLHRVISAKLRMRNAGDSAALAAARWQGHALNMIGDLNLIQASMIASDYGEAYEDWETDWQEWDDDGRVGDEPFLDDYLDEYLDYDSYAALHELRLRLEFVGPLAAFAVAQQTAFNNGALSDPVLASNLVELAEDLRYKIDEQPYDNAFKDYADLLDALVVQGVAVSSYGLRLPGHPLAQETFYAAIAEALADWWCPMQKYRYQLENYEDFESWGKLDAEFEHRAMFDLHLGEYSVGLSVDGVEPTPPYSALIGNPDYWLAVKDYLASNDVVNSDGYGEYIIDGMWETFIAEWHVYDNSWAKRWPRPAGYDDETSLPKLDPLALRGRVKDEYNYLGAVADVGMLAKVGRGILSSSDNMTVDLSYKAKAKVFGFLNLEYGKEPPNYFGFVFPCFEEVRLVHSDIGDKVLSGVFYEHVTKHLEPYLEGGPDAADPQCPYCRLLVAWEDLDRKKGLEWLDRAYNDDDNPCRPEDEEDDPAWGDAGGGATGGS